jgi:hypothetical protein
MIVSSDELDQTGTAYHVFDANGVELSDVCWCDTETGEVKHPARDEDGNIKTTIRFDGAVVTVLESQVYPAPLRLLRGD